MNRKVRRIINKRGYQSGFIHTQYFPSQINLCRMTSPSPNSSRPPTILQDDIASNSRLRIFNWELVQISCIWDVSVIINCFETVRPDMLTHHLSPYSLFDHLRECLWPQMRPECQRRGRHDRKRRGSGTDHGPSESRLFQTEWRICVNLG